MFLETYFSLPHELIVSVSFYTTFLPFIASIAEDEATFVFTSPTIAAILPRNRVTSVEPPSCRDARDHLPCTCSRTWLNTGDGSI